MKKKEIRRVELEPKAIRNENKMLLSVSFYVHSLNQSQSISIRTSEHFTQNKSVMLDAVSTCASFFVN